MKNKYLFKLKKNIPKRQKMKLNPQSKYHIKKTFFKIFILFIYFSLISTEEDKFIIYLKTNGNINEMKIINSLNSIKYQNDNINTDENGLFKQEIDSTFGDNITFNIFKKGVSLDISVGVLLQIDYDFYEIENSKLKVLFDKELTCDENTIIDINDTYQKEISYCSKNSINNLIISIKIPEIYEINDCYEACSKCDEMGNSINHKCTKCNNLNQYYFKEDDESGNCFKESNIEDGYYLDETEKIFKKCNDRCLTCKTEGTTSSSNCIKCNNDENYHFDNLKANHCVTYDELQDINYYLDENDDKYKLCHESCLKCDGPNNNNCINCNNSKGYYFKENDNSKVCFTKNTISIGYYLNSIDNLFKKCNSRCLTCDIGGTDSLSNCKKCKNNNNYHFDPVKANHCIQLSELSTSNYFINEQDQFQICHESCLSCNGPNNNNCISCNGNTFFQTENFPNQCLQYSQIPLNYYSVYTSNKFIYYKCHESCKTCLTGGNYKCQECNIEGGYYPVEEKTGYCLMENEIPSKYYLDRINKKMFKCHTNCNSCSRGFNNETKEMNCDTCISGTYFQNISSKNCIQKPDTRYYVDLYNGKKTLFPCHENCLTCNRGGDNEDNQCTSCIDDLYFDDEITTNCLDDDIECAIGCAKCYKNKTNSDYGVLSADKMCKRCSHKMGYFPLQKYTQDQFYVSCYPFNNSPKNYIFDETEKIHKLCYKTCQTCFQVGDVYNHSCITCDASYIFIDEEPCNCFPKCMHYYYYNKYKQYKCTESDECPVEYPYLIINKTKCVDNCYKDNEFNLMFKNECVQKCPEGTSAYLYIYNGEFTAKCVDSNEIIEESECKLNIKNNNELEYDKITEELLEKYAKEYVHDYPVANKYVTSYSSSKDSLNKYLIVIYKLEKCPKQKVEGYISIGLDECIDKVKTKYIIIQNIVVEIFYIIRKNAPPQINYFLYHPDTGEKLDLSSCSGAKLAIKTSIFDNGKVNEQLVKYFSNLKVNLFDIKDPFFTDICFNFAKDDKDVPLDDRIELYYQNVSLCEDGCTYMGINLETFEVECSCDVKNIQTNTNGDIAKSFLDNPLSNEVFGVITNSNIEVLKCIKNAFNLKVVFKNYGGMMMVGILVVQIISTIFIKYQIKQVRKYIYSLIIQLKFPPKRKMKTARFQNINNLGGNTTETINRQSKDILVYNSSDTENEKNKNKKKDKNENNINNNDVRNKNKTVKYQLIKQASINSISSFNENGKYNKNKYSYVKKGSIPNSTSYTNFTGQPNNQNNSPNENNNTILNINNSSGSGSGSGGTCGIRINSGASDSALKKLGEIGEQSSDEYEYNDFKENKEYNTNNGINKKNFYIKERKGLKFMDNKLNKKNFCSNSNSNLEDKLNIYNISNENNIQEKEGNNNEKEININIKKNQEKNIKINEIKLDNGQKDITIFHRRNGIRLISAKKILKSNKPLLLDLGNNQSKNSKNKLNKKEEQTKDLKNKLRKEIISEIKDKLKNKRKLERKKKQIMVSYEHKEYNDKEINELDYDDAIIYDKRNYCKIFWYTLKEKQTLVNTFFVKDTLKPFSIKLLFLIFTFSCYFVINGFLYNEEYVSKKLKSEKSKTFVEYLSDSIERILYTSIVGGVISFTIGILFNTGKKIDNVINKNKNNKILLNGEIAKIYRCNNIRIIIFVVLQYILMIVFTIYIFCFCYVYPNNKLDWFESSLLVIGIMQSFSLFSSFILSSLKYLSIKFQWEICFKINTYLDDNL